jgi:hypothetical protein
MATLLHSQQETARSQRLKQKQKNERKPFLYFPRKEAKLKNSMAKAKILIADCSYAKGKMTSGSYASLKNDEKKRSAFGKFIKSQIDDAMSNVPKS